MATLHVMVGIPGSGKSTWAKEKGLDTGGVIVSSDVVRVDLYGTNYKNADNEKVFQEVNRQLQAALDNGQDAIFDATNTNRKKRTHLISQVIKADEYKCYYFATSYLDCVRRNEERGLPVSEAVIDKMYKGMHVPIQQEGWDTVQYVFPERYEAASIEDIGVKTHPAKWDFTDHDSFFNSLPFALYIHVSDMVDCPQDNPHHVFSVSRHTYKVVKKCASHKEYIMHLGGYEYYSVLMWAALFHDSGKPFCKSFVSYEGEPTEYAHFFGHENVSAQKAVIALYEMGFSNDFIQKVAAIVQHHMKLMDSNIGKKGINKLKMNVGLDLYELLTFHLVADVDGKQ